MFTDLTTGMKWKEYVVRENCWKFVKNVLIIGGENVNPVVEGDQVSIEAKSNRTFGDPPESKQQLEDELQQTQKSAYTAGTYKNLLCQWHSFFRFCEKYNIKQWPVEEHTLCLFAQYLAHKFVSASSIRDYISRVRTLHVLT